MTAELPWWIFLGYGAVAYNIGFFIARALYRRSDAD